MISRRAFLTLPFLTPLRTFAAAPGHYFQYDHILGTSLDLAVWTVNAGDARRAELAVLREIDRLAAILNTRDDASEISRAAREGTTIHSPELAEVFRLYRQWEDRTAGILSLRPAGSGSPMNVDALGKAYIIDRAVLAARRAAPEVEGILLNIGGDIVSWGKPCEISIANPEAPYDNAEPLTRILLENAAVATSGTSARGSHLIDGRTGEAPAVVGSATAVARNAVTANALATTLCIAGAREGVQLVERTEHAEALLVVPAGNVQRSSGFARLERYSAKRITAQSSKWPAGHQVRLSFSLRNPEPRSLRPYLAAWVVDESGKLVKIIVLWGTKAEWTKELTTFWDITNKGNKDLLFPVTRPTRNPGKYQLAWDGVDSQGRPVDQGSYRIVVECNRERGVYTRSMGTIVCGSEPSTLTLDATENFEAVAVQYGPRPTPA